MDLREKTPNNDSIDYLPIKNRAVNSLIALARIQKIMLWSPRHF